MNAIMDLTSRATAFITAIQTALLHGAVQTGQTTQAISILSLNSSELGKKLKLFSLKEVLETKLVKAQADTARIVTKEDDDFIIRAAELLWVSKKKISDKELSRISLDYAVHIAEQFVSWIENNRQNGIAKMENAVGKYPTPHQWRTTISSILYAHPQERVNLVRALEYLPLQIILAMGAGKYSAYEQRLLQVWNLPPTYQDELFSKKESKFSEKFHIPSEQTHSPEVLLTHEVHLYNQLIDKDVPISFEQIFTRELDEIALNRKRRLDEMEIARPNHSGSSASTDSDIDNPFERGQKMRLNALAFSGGGIRSATFNLGILQGLASHDLIRKFDYLSTVSGGGYIGCWLAAWIKREGSLVKVSNRLCPDLSPDPAGEELRPIKWLRMFSNYFAPNASVMSADFWTVGITWVRNTILNQTIIFLSLLSVLFAGIFLFTGWSAIASQSILTNQASIIIFSLVALIPVALLAGFGMHVYNSEQTRFLKTIKLHAVSVSYGIMGCGIFAAYFVSALLCSSWEHNNSPTLTFSAKFETLKPAACINFAALMIVAIIGNYARNIENTLTHGTKLQRSILAWGMLAFTATLTSLLSLVSLAGVWLLLQKLGTLSGVFSNPKMQFILSFPLMLEVFSINLVTRMALLGRYFPDEKREWWGRMGAYIHRTSLIWILVASAALFGQIFLKRFFAEYPRWSTTLSGGWIALILSSLKAAYSSKISGELTSQSSMARMINILALVGPYIFLVGLLIFLPALIPPIYNLVHLDHFNTPIELAEFNPWHLLLITIGLFIAPLILSMQLGLKYYGLETHRLKAVTESHLSLL